MIVQRLIIVCFFTFSLFACADKEPDKTTSLETEQDVKDRDSEITSEVAELWDFHEVIYQIWHEAWPEKNTEMLKELIPEIEEGFNRLQQAELPGILRDKKETWAKGIQEMTEIIEAYKKAAASNQNEILLKEAENLHSQFEKLVRIVRPVMKEIDLFHQELYRLYHYYLPEYDLAKIKTSNAELMERMKPIDKAQLPDRLKDKKPVFDQARIELNKALMQLQQSLEDEAPKVQVVEKIESVHDAYQQLVGIFE